MELFFALSFADAIGRKLYKPQVNIDNCDGRFKGLASQSPYFTVRGQSYFSRLPKY